MPGARVPDLRQHFAAERTVLAYVRTGLALIGIGFVVARFGLLLREIAAVSRPAAPAGLSLWFGTILVLAGGAVGLLAAREYRAQVHRLNAALAMTETPSALALVLSVLLTIVGCAMAAYLLLTQ